MSVLFFLMIPFNETTVSKLNDKYKSQKTAENTTIITLYHYINMKNKKKRKKKVKDFSEIIQINKKLSVKTLNA